ncbi:protein nrt1/ ptr family 5.5 [Fagus crenata]
MSLKALVLADILTAYAIFVMMTYLTDVWSLTITHAAAIVNVFTGVAAIMPIGMGFLVDTFMGDKWMLLLSSIAYSIGMTSLAMSTPPFLSNAAGNCGAYKPECIGDAQKVLFYTALALIAIGISGHITSLGSFLEQQKGDQDDSGKKTPWQVPGICVVMLLPIVGCFALPYIKPWSVRFGIPAICTVVATFLFLSGFFCSSYKHSGTLRPGSPLTTVLRVFVASASKMFSHLPQHDKELNGTLRPGPHTGCLRCLDKAAIVDGETNEQDRRKRCSEAELEETKIFICMTPMWMTFIMCGLVISVGNTFFLEQANNLNRKVGTWKVPLPIFKAFYDLVKDPLAKKVIPKKYGIRVAMLFSILCCITAAKMETRRLDVIRRHGLLDKPKEQIPMSMFVLLPQYLLLGALDGISNASIDQFFTNHAPESMRRYSKIFSHAVIGAGTVGSVLSVYVVSKVSERVEGKSWFQDTLNKSRLDNYYWTLTVLSSINLVLYILLACCIPIKTVNEASEKEESTQP